MGASTTLSTSSGNLIATSTATTSSFCLQAVDRAEDGVPANRIVNPVKQGHLDAQEFPLIAIVDPLNQGHRIEVLRGERVQSLSPVGPRGGAMVVDLHRESGHLRIGLPR